jgi:hypothetical protein
MRKIPETPPSYLRALITAAPSLTDQQKGQAVAVLLSDVLGSIDRAVAGAAQSEPGIASVATDVTEWHSNKADCNS